MKAGVRKAVIPAAGLGTRFLPATKAQPKEMLPLVDKPIIQYVVEEAVASGITDILIITGRGKRALEDHFDRVPEVESRLLKSRNHPMLDTVREIADLADIHFIRQKEALGLGHAILTARRHVGDEPFAVLLGDEVSTGERPCLQQLLEAHAVLSARAVVAIKEVPHADVDRYGIVKLAGSPPETGRPVLLEDLVEKPAPARSPSNLAVVGRYVLPAAIFDILARTGPGHGGEIQLTDALRILAAEGQVWGLPAEGRRFDVGAPLGFLEATVELALGRQDLAGPFLDFLKRIVASEAVGRDPGAPPREPALEEVPALGEVAAGKDEA